MNNLVASVAINVSKATLKRINPKLKLPKKGTEKGSNPRPDQVKELMMHEIETEAPPPPSGKSRYGYKWHIG